jgi:dolichyl-phosphate-mannose--protein O-mannosyl transferase
LFSSHFFALRFLPALFGTLLVILFYALIKLLTNSKKIALIGGFFILFENAFLVQSRHILIDIFLIFFGLASLYFFLKGTKTKERKGLLFFVLAGLSMGACISIKWTGLGFLGFIFLLMILQLTEQKIDFKKFFKIGIILATGVFFVYFLQFWIHFSLIPGGDSEIDSYLGENFQERSFFQKIVIINGQTFRLNQSLALSHPDDSRFYQWPLMEKPVDYWSKTQEGETLVKIGLFGNPVIWGLSSFGILISIASLFFKRLRKEIYPSTFILFFIVYGYLVNLLPFILIPRSTFIYHYLPAYLFAILNLAIILNWVSRYNRKIFWMLIFLVILGFSVVAPATYGFKPIVPYSILE